jgi:exosome complex exonuclease RRP6
MIDYARSDTHYLLNIYDHLRNSLLEMSSRPSTPQPELPTGESTPMLEVPTRQNPQAALRKTLELSAETALKLYEREEYHPNGCGSGGWKLLLRKSLPKDSEDTIEAAVLIALHKWRDEVARKLDESP